MHYFPKQNSLSLSDFFPTDYFKILVKFFFNQVISSNGWGWEVILFKIEYFVIFIKRLHRGDQSFHKHMEPNNVFNTLVNEMSEINKIFRKLYLNNSK